MSATSNPSPNREPNFLDQIGSLDGMIQAAFIAQDAPEDVRDKWDGFLEACKKWRGGNKNAERGNDSGSGS